MGTGMAGKRAAAPPLQALLDDDEHVASTAVEFSTVVLRKVRQRLRAFVLFPVSCWGALERPPGWGR